MPTYDVTAPDGRRVQLTGDNPPTDADLDDIFANLPPARVRGSRRDEIAADVEAKTAAAAPDETWGKAQMAGAAGFGRALADPAIGAARLIGMVPGMGTSPTAAAATGLAALLSPVSEAAGAAEEAAGGMKGSETVAAVAGAIGSGLGSMPAAMVPVLGPGLSAGSAGLQSYESTRRESLRMLMEGGMLPDQAEAAAHRVALQSGLITGTVTGAFNRWGHNFGFGRGVERGLSEEVRKLSSQELAKSAARPMLKAVLKEAGGEGTEEAVDELLQQATVVWQYDPNQTFESAAKAVLKAGGLGAVAGGVIGGSPAAAAVLGDRAAAIREQRATGHNPGVDDVDGPAPADASPDVPAKDIKPEGPQTPPGVWVNFTLPDGRRGRADAGTLENVEAAKEYVSRTNPGAVFTGVDEIVAPPPEEPGADPAPELPAGEEADVDAALEGGRAAKAVDDAADTPPPPRESFSQRGEAEGQGETLLDIVEGAGGINYDDGSKFAGEYDALTTALTEGDLSRRTKSRLSKLLKRDRSGREIDQVLEVVREEQSAGRGNWAPVESAEDLTQELLSAVDREGRVDLTPEESQQHWEAVVTSRRGRSAVQNGGQAVPSERLRIGDEFSIRGRRMVVERIDPNDGAVQVRQDGGADEWGRKQIPAGMDIFPDRGSYKPKPPPVLGDQKGGTNEKEWQRQEVLNEPFSLRPGGSVLALGPGDERGGIGEERARGEIRRLLGGEPSRVRVVHDAGWTHNGRVVEGAKRKDGSLVINSAALAGEGDVGRVLRHELLHDVWADPATREAWAGLRSAMDRRSREDAARGEGYTAAVTEEAALDEVEARVDRRSGVFRRFTDSIMRALYRRGRADMAGALFGTDRLADVDAKALVGYAMRLDRVEGGGGSKPANDRFSLANETARQSVAGRLVTPLLSTLARDGALLMESMQGKPVFSEWSKAMMERHGAEVRPFLSRAWDLAGDVRWALGMNLSPAAVADVNRITRAAEESPSALEKTPIPVYDAEKEAKWWNKIVRPSDVIRYFGGDDLLRKKQLLDLRTAYQAAAVKKQSEALRIELENAFYGDKAGPVLRFFRQFSPKAKLRRFMRHALPIAAHLNVTGGTPDNWTFADFEQRAGFMPEREANFGGLSTGDSVFRANPLTGEMETLRLGPKIELESGAKGFQILRPLPATRQAEVYEWARSEFPEFVWFLDTWVDPRLKDTRVVINGVEVPVFNRLSLAGRYAQSDPSFMQRAAYTPDVAIGGGLVALVKRYATARRVTFREGTTSPGRKYETGSAREAAATLDLLSGFNVRAMQVLQEDVRKEWMRGVLSSAADVPRQGLPVGWTSIDNAMASVWQAVQTLRKFDDPLNFPQVTERLRDDASPEYQRFFGEIMRLKASDTPKMIPSPLVDALIQDFAVTKELGLVGQLARVWARNWKAFLLLMPDTFVENRTDNYLRLFMQAHRQMILGALKGGDRLAFREARKLAWASIVGIVPGVRPAFGLNNTALFNKVKAEVLPAEVFESGQRLMDLWVEKGSTEEEIQSLREMGRNVRAAGVALRDLGPLILEKTGYGKMDVGAKQQFAFASLMAKAEEAAARAGLRGEQARAFAEQWVLSPPEDAVRRAVAGANRLLLNYGDTPGWLSSLARNPWSNTFVAFPLFRYHFIGREIDRSTAAFRSLHRMLVRGKKLSRDEWASSLADSISYVTLPLMGYAASKVAGALTDSLLSGAPGGDDDDDDPRNMVGASSVWKEDESGEMKKKPLARELVTANRLNVSAMLRQAGVELDGEKDYWWHIKDYPLVRSTALLYLAAEDARKHGPVAGVTALMSGMRDMLSSLAGAGQAIKVPAKIAAELEASEAGRPAFTGVDPYATGVPLKTYITLQALNLIPGNRQADEVVKWLDPVPRRVTRSKALDYEPGIAEAFQAGGVTGLADRVARGVASGGDFASPLPPQGQINRRLGTVEDPREFNLASRIAMAFGQNIKTVPRKEYQEAIAP